jgi:alkylated DNA repair protein alkB homolog 6
VATVSLGSHTVLNIYPKLNKEKQFRILQEPGSLLLTTGQLYIDYMHSISEITIDEDLSEDTVINWSLLGNPDKYHGSIQRDTRTSLTYRDVLKVVKIKF